MKLLNLKKDLKYACCHSILFPPFFCIEHKTTHSDAMPARIERKGQGKYDDAEEQGGGNVSGPLLPNA